MLFVLTHLVIASCMLGVQGAWRSKEKILDQPVAHDDGNIHICIFSDRVEGMQCTLKSTALNAAHPEKIHIWVVTDNITSVHEAASYLADTGLQIHALDLDQVVSGLLETGFEPVWTWKEYNSSVLDGDANYNPDWLNENSAQPGNWDHSSMHMHPLNHLRFYIPHMREFKELDRIIFMDDDLIIQGDVQRAWDAKDNLKENQMLVGACEIWKWGDETGVFEYSGKNSSYANSSALAMSGREVNDTFCENTDGGASCVGKNHWDNLQKRHLEINGQKLDFKSQPEWNFGFTLFDLQKWRKMQLTVRYEKWMKANYEDHIFPETSLMYGLGIPFLTYYGHVACWDDVTSPKILVRDGFGYITYPEFAFNGLNASYLTSGFVLHYDGWLKPWYPNADKIFAIPYQKTMEGVKAEDYKVLMENPETVIPQYNLHTNSKKTSSSFLLLSDPRAGSEWLMRTLDQHPEVCVSGTDNDGNSRIGFPHDVFLPYNKGELFFAKHTKNMRMQCYFGFLQHWLPEVIKNRDSWCADHSKAGDLSRHMPYMCNWASMHPETSLNSNLLFSEYFSAIMSADPHLFTCRCPAQTTTVGLRMMTDWVGNAFNPETVSFQKNYDFSDSDTDVTHKETPEDASVQHVTASLWESLERVRPKIVLFKRNIVDEIISRYVSAAAGVKLAKDENDLVKFNSAESVSLKPQDVSAEMDKRLAHRAYINLRLRELNLDVLELSYEDCYNHGMEHCIKRIEYFLGIKHFHDYNMKTILKMKQKNITDYISNIDDVVTVIQNDSKASSNLFKQWITNNQLKSSLSSSGRIDVYSVRKFDEIGHKPSDYSDIRFHHNAAKSAFLQLSESRSLEENYLGN